MADDDNEIPQDPRDPGVPPRLLAGLRAQGGPRSDYATQPDAPTELTEQRFAENFKVRREMLGLSQVSVAQAMKDRGWLWRQQTVTRIETGQRSIRLGEAKALADILQVSLDRLTGPTAEMQVTETLTAWASQAIKAFAQIRDGTKELLRVRAWLDADPSVAAPMRQLPSPQLARAVADARAARALTPDGAVQDGMADLARDSETLAGLHRMSGTVELRPATFAEAAESVIAALRAVRVIDLDLGDMDANEAGRLQEFVAGAVAARGGEIRDLGGVRRQLIPAGRSADGRNS